MPDETKPTLRCSSCGHVGTDVSEWPAYVGGYADKRFFLHCDNLRECSRRQDENIAEVLNAS